MVLIEKKKIIKHFIFVFLGVIATQKNQENVNANINNFNDGKDIKYITPFEISSNCWICEGWQETKFKISLCIFFNFFHIL